MPCTPIKGPDGKVYALACSRGRRKRCSVCGRLEATKLCDGPVAAKASGTCDVPLCSKCSFRPDPAKDKDYCPRCAKGEPWKKGQAVLALEEP